MRIRPDCFWAPDDRRACDFRSRGERRPDSKHSRIAAAILLGGDGRGLQSLAQHASQLTHVCLDALTVSGQPARLTADVDPDVVSAADAAKVHVVAILSNYAAQRWDTDAVEGLIQADASVQEAFGDKLVEALRGMGATGVMIDWQQIDPMLSGKLVDFLRALRLRLQETRLPGSPRHSRR